MRMRTLIVLFTGILFSITSCDIINKEEAIPAYIFIPGFTLNTDVESEGTNSHKITEAHVFVANELIGIFTLPATVPVLMENTQEVQIFPAIRTNGLGDITDIYPFYRSFQTTLDFVPGNVDTIMPVIEYIDNARFFFAPQEGFEDGTLTFGIDLDGDPATTIEVTNQEVFEGDGSGIIALESGDAQMELGSNLITELPIASSSSTFLELNYKTDVSFLVGVIGYDSQGRIIYSLIDKGVNPNEEWNKIYFDFTDEMIDLFSVSDQLSGWRLVIISDLIGGAENQANIYLDNIKMVQFR